MSQLSRWLAVGFIVLTVTGGYSQEKSKEEAFIELYSKAAIHCMQDTGIPASIKLAQLILETGWGGSSLSEANNLYGIKCGSSWEGATVYHKDDDTDENGELRESCFRAYASPEESFRDHSSFLMNNSNYEALFTYGNDYKKWAHGLQKAGYATNPNYANLLIRIIEEHNLYRYDEVAPIIVLEEAPESTDLVEIEHKQPFSDMQYVEMGQNFKYEETTVIPNIVQAVELSPGEVAANSQLPQPNQQTQSYGASTASLREEEDLAAVDTRVATTTQHVTTKNTGESQTLQLNVGIKKNKQSLIR